MLDSAPGARALGDARDGPERLPAVRLGVDLRGGEAVAQTSSASSAARVVAARSIRRCAVARKRPGRAQREAALGAGGRHRDRPALVRLAEHVGVGHEHVVEEHLGEALVAVEPLDAAHGDARRREVDEEVGEAVVPFGVGIAAEQPEQVRAERAARRPRLLAGQPPAAARRRRARPCSGCRRGRCPRSAPTSPGTTSARPRPSWAGCGPSAPGVPNSKIVGASRKMPFCVTRWGAPAA